ncbi:hypothetical protein PQR02_08535 [Paraburkholderia sediminicola]|uniref:Uncharacterized protein n=1 Tax=Paraburkholderia rhynchosiae TaxID=487049 RepID=A0ACC7NA73_9BURK
MITLMPDRARRKFMLERLTASRYKKAVMDQVIFVHRDAIEHAS